MISFSAGGASSTGVKRLLFFCGNEGVKIERWRLYNIHGAIIPSLLVFCFIFKAILPDWDGVITPFVCLILLSKNQFRG